MTTYRQPFKGDYPITQRFGEIVPGVTVNGKPHTGIDYACPQGTNILASAAGTVMFAAWDPTGYGNMVIIKHNDGRATLYAHLSLISVAVNHIVYQGEKIGESGSTGNVYPKGEGGAHLHFEARNQWNNYTTAFDPMNLPLMNYADVAENATTTQQPDPFLKKNDQLKEPQQLGKKVKIVCRDGANVFNQDWTMRIYGFPQGTPLYFTGRTEKRPGFPDLTYCEVYEEPKKFYVAIHDGRTQILDNDAEEE